MTDEGKPIRRVEGVIAEPLGEQVVLLDPTTDAFVRLNAAGVLLWDELERPRTVRELADALVERFGIERERALADAETFAGEIVERGVAVRD